MRSYSFLASVLALTICLMSVPTARALVLVDEDFSGAGDYLDLSTAVTWGGNTGAVSAFEVTNDPGSVDGAAISLTSDAFDHTAFSSNDLRTFTSIDFIFSGPINHSTSITTIDLRMRWASIGGEGNRFNVTLVHDYPQDGGGNPTLDLDLDDRYDDDFTDPKTHWWGRPAYQARLLGGDTTDRPILQYGGGPDVEGEWEATENFWLSGFNSAPGGGSPGSPSAEGWVRTDSVVSTSYQDVRYVVYPDRQELLVYNPGTGEYDLLGTQNLLSDPDNPTYFNYFDTFEGLRLYWRGSGGSSSDVFLDSVVVSTDVIPEPATAALLMIGAACFIRRRRRWAKP